MWLGHSRIGAGEIRALKLHGQDAKTRQPQAHKADAGRDTGIGVQCWPDVQFGNAFTA